jgi:hypothetical protein
MALQFQHQKEPLLDNLFADTKDQDWREDFNSPVERKVKYRNLDADNSDYFGNLFENILRSELTVMMDEHYSGYHFTHFIDAKSEAIIQAIHKRLIGYGYFVQKERVRSFLTRINHVFKAKIARGEAISAAQYLPAPEKPKQPSAQKKGRGKAKEKRKAKQGRKRPIMGFGSIAEASRETGESYQYLQKRSMKALKEDNSI